MNDAAHDVSWSYEEFMLVLGRCEEVTKSGYYCTSTHKITASTVDGKQYDNTAVLNIDYWDNIYHSYIDENATDSRPYTLEEFINF